MLLGQHGQHEIRLDVLFDCAFQCVNGLFLFHFRWFKCTSLGLPFFGFVSVVDVRHHLLFSLRKEISGPRAASWLEPVIIIAVDQVVFVFNKILLIIIRILLLRIIKEIRQETK